MDLTAPAPLSIETLTVNLILGLLLSLVLSFFYVRYGTSLSNRVKFAQNLPLLTLITLLVISIVKSSLALSLGLVGALSIVRFRTAIKDPEELLYLFFAIALGLGFGADQRIPTLIAFVIIMLFLFIKAIFAAKRKNGNQIYLNIQINNSGDHAEILGKINQLLIDLFKKADMRRVDHQGDFLEMTYYVVVKDVDSVSQLIQKVQAMYPGSAVSFVEQNNLLGG
ncbi:MAG: DUF4956 domain-containing protein [Anaerolineaceae bacterium]|nr:DUF4956 domain-containing protein [Anaerolineaceae bacterium]